MLLHPRDQEDDEDDIVGVDDDDDGVSTTVIKNVAAPTDAHVCAQAATLLQPPITLPFGLSKAQRGRFKKLSKRAASNSRFLDCISNHDNNSNNNNNNNNNNNGMSGLATIDQVEELRYLLELKRRAASIHHEIPVMDGIASIASPSSSNMETNKNLKSSHDDSLLAPSILLREQRDMKQLEATDSSPPTAFVPAATPAPCSFNWKLDSNQWPQCKDGIDHRNLIQRILFQSTASTTPSPQHNPSRNNGNSKNNNKRKRKGFVMNTDPRGCCTTATIDINDSNYTKKDTAADMEEDEEANNNKHSKKQERQWIKTLQNQSCNIPKWAQIHNLACMTSLAIIEFSLEQDYRTTINCSSNVNSSKNNHDTETQLRHHQQQSQSPTRQKQQQQQQQQQCDQQSPFACFMPSSLIITTNSSNTENDYHDISASMSATTATTSTTSTRPTTASKNNDNNNDNIHHFKSLRNLLSNQGLHGRSVLPVKTHLFQEKMNRPPQDISNVLLYCNDSCSKNDDEHHVNNDCDSDNVKLKTTNTTTKKKKVASNCQTNKSNQNNKILLMEKDIHHLLLTKYTLSQQQLKKAHFPFFSQSTILTGTAAATSKSNNEIMDKSNQHASQPQEEKHLVQNGESSLHHSSRQTLPLSKDELKESFSTERGGLLPTNRQFVRAIQSRQHCNNTASAIRNGNFLLPGRHCDKKFNTNVGNKYEQTASASSEPRIYGLDCEMVTTCEGPTLARATLIQFCPTYDNPEKYNVVMDMLVKPELPVLNYLSEYSGITAKMLEAVETRIENVQTALLTFICLEDIIVGHSLENDFCALRFVHDRVVDTAHLFMSEGGRKHSLRHLSLVLLKQNIQSTSNGRGHCSIEDAAAALTLAIRRARLGDSFNLRKRPRGKFMIELIDDVRKRTAEGTPHHYASMATRNRGALVCIGPKSWIKSHAPTKSTAHILTCESVLCRSQEAILSWLRNGKRRAAFLCANLVVPHNSEGVAKADELIGKVAQSAPTSTIVVFVFQKHFARARLLHDQKRALINNTRSTLQWTPVLETQLSDAIHDCVHCDAFWMGTV